MRSIVLSLAVALSLTACASAGPAGGPERPRGNREVITAEELAGAHAQNAYEAVRSLRPSFLMTQGGTTRAHGVQVIVDGVPRGGATALQQMNVADIVEIRHLSPTDATMLYGTGYTGGAIVVKTAGRR